MQPEIIIVVLAVFIMGGTMGAAGTVLCQWILGKMSAPASRRIGAGDPRELEVLKEELADMAVRLHSVDERLDFTEQLLGGALSGARPPEPLPPVDRARSEDGSDGSSSRRRSDRRLSRSDCRSPSWTTWTTHEVSRSVRRWGSRL
jgi:hypothetical protein